MTTLISELAERAGEIFHPADTSGTRSAIAYVAYEELNLSTQAIKAAMGFITPDCVMDEVMRMRRFMDARDPRCAPEFRAQVLALMAAAWRIRRADQGRREAA